MGTHRNTIELNGQTYDVSTGKVLSGNTAHRPATAKPKVMDGFFHKRSTQPKSKPVATHPKTTAVPHHVVASKPKPHVERPAAPHTPHRKPQPSKTLVRRAVSRPAIGEHDVPYQSLQTRTPDSIRLKRAKAVSKSRVISRFGNMHEPDPIPKRIEPLAVKKAPESTSTHKPAHHKPAHHSNESAAETHFKKALANANAHEHRATKKSKHRIAHKLGLGHKSARFASVTLAILLLAGFFAYQNIPNISMKIASTRAGFSAQMPGYTPAGFGVSGPVQYGPGYVSVSFNSRTDDQSYKVSQRVSNWNSEALADNFLGENGKQYQTFEDKGRTIYVYDGTNATWVNGGVWYQIEGNNQLKNDQLIDIASSM